MLSMALLHWLISEGVFLVDVQAFSSDGSYVAEDGIITVGWSPTALIFANCLALVIVIALFVVGAFKFPSTMPLASTNSMAISAACHPGPQASARLINKPLKYGILVPVENDLDIAPAAFSADPVYSLDGKLQIESERNLR